MPESVKSIASIFATGLAWLGALSVQDFTTFVLASLFTIVSIIYVVIGIQNRKLDKQIKQKQLEDLNNV